MDIEAQVQNAALKFLMQREHSQYELREKLRKRNYDNVVITQVLTQLQNNDLQSDSRFVAAYVNMKIQRGFGPVRIQQELRERGITDELIMQYLPAAAEELWIKLVLVVRAKRFGTNVPKVFAMRAKQMRFLQYRGFTAAQITQGMQIVNENK